MGATVTATEKHKDLKRRATVIYRRDEEILFVRKRNAKWNLPGGRVEQGETPLQAAVREMAEETGLTVDQLSYVFEYEQDRVIHFLFEARRAGQRKPRPCNEIDDCRWFSANDLTSVTFEVRSGHCSSAAHPTRRIDQRQASRFRRRGLDVLPVDPYGPPEPDRLEPKRLNETRT
jgi:8-oxo-dGTP diphosphatase